MKVSLYIGNDKLKEVEVNKKTDTITYIWLKPLTNQSDEETLNREMVFRRIGLNKFILTEIR